MTATDPTLTGFGRGRGAAAAARGAGASRRGRAEEDETPKGMPLLVAAFLLSLTVPLFITFGPVLLQPYRIVVLAAFFPLLVKFLATVQLRPWDWLMAAHVVWVVMSMIAVHGFSRFEAAGIHVVEVGGAWMLGRVGIRNVAEFRRMVLIYFMLVMAMLPLALIEGIIRDNKILRWLPSSPAIVWTEPRFGLRRAQVVFSHPIIYGVFVSSSLGLVWFCFETPGKFFVQSVRAGLVAFATFLSLSAGALLAYLAQAGLIAWEVLFQKEANRWRIFFWTVAIAYVTIDLLSARTPFHILVQYGTFNSASAYNRILIFRYGMQNVWRSPVVGIGFSDWSRPFWMGDSVDNFWLLNAMRHGIPAFVFLALGKLLMMRDVGRTMLSDPQERAARMGWMVSMGGIIIAGGTVHYWTAMLTFITFLFAAGGWMCRPEAFLDGAQRRRGDAAPAGKPLAGAGAGAEGLDEAAPGGRRRGAPPAGGTRRPAAPAPGGRRRGGPPAGGRRAASPGAPAAAPGTPATAPASAPQAAPLSGSGAGPEAPAAPAPRSGPVRPPRPVRGVFDPAAPRAPQTSNPAPDAPPNPAPNRSAPPDAPTSGATPPSAGPGGGATPSRAGPGGGATRPPRPRGPAR